ncbi:MAG: hypothetical protein M1826_004998 [Phylliscum demangeonii]|nr:MAG: hypothetical protein M1826_004998 [Phylliscum demangeonii]
MSSHARSRTSYDSDSSGSSDSRPTSTNVLLGYAAPGLTDDLISHVGGQATWLQPRAPPPSARLVRCKACQRMMRLLLQLNGDLPDRFPGHERRLYVWACSRKSCHRKEGSVRVVRGTMETEKEEGGGLASASSSSPSSSAPLVDERRAEDDDDDDDDEVRRPQQQRMGEDLFTPGTGSQRAGNAPSALANPFLTPSLVFPSTTAAAAATTNPFADPPSSSSSSLSLSLSPSTAFPPLPSTASLAAAAAPPAQQQKPLLSAGHADQHTGTAINALTNSFAATVRLNPGGPVSPSTAPPPPPPPPYERWPSADQLPRPYPLSYLDAEYETLDDRPSMRTPTVTMKDYDDDDDDNKKKTGRGRNTTTTTTTTTATDTDANTADTVSDTAFQRFVDRLASNPQQVLRYEFGGAPLLASKTDAVGRLMTSTTTTTTTTTSPHAVVPGVLMPAFPRCPNCRAPRVFEVQLMPYAIVALEETAAAAAAGDDEGGGDGDVDGMEWSTIVVAVCGRDCVPRGPRTTTGAVAVAGTRKGEGEARGEMEEVKEEEEEEEHGEGSVVVRYVEEWVGVQWEEEEKHAR